MAVVAQLFTEPRYLRMARRGSSVLLADTQQAAFRTKFERYVSGKIDGGVALWEFGAYVAADAVLDKEAPILEDLLFNADLWGLMLLCTPNGMCRDSYVTNATQTAMGKMKNMNNTDYPICSCFGWSASCTAR